MYQLGNPMLHSVVHPAEAHLTEQLTRNYFSNNLRDIYLPYATGYSGYQGLLYSGRVGQTGSKANLFGCFINTYNIYFCTRV